MRIIILTGMILAGIAVDSRADIYRYVDRDGVIHYTNVPTHSKFQALGWEERFERHVGNYDPVIRRVSDRYGVEAALIKAIIKAESNYNPSAVSRKGAIGLMQLMPATAAYLNISNPHDPNSNIEGGTRYIKYLLEVFDDDLKLALAAYNAGETTVMKYGKKIPPYKETKNYVSRVLNYLSTYRKYASIDSTLARN